MTSAADVQVEVDELRSRVEDLTALVRQFNAEPAGMPDSDGEDVVPEKVFDTVEAWVDAVFIRLAARKQAAWCRQWREHPEARARLIEVWKAWEFANAQADKDLQSMENWLRLVLDYHAAVLLDRAGPFADCRPHHQPGHLPEPLAATDYASAGDPTDEQVEAAINQRFPDPPSPTVNLTDSDPSKGDR